MRRAPPSISRALRIPPKLSAVLSGSRSTLDGPREDRHVFTPWHLPPVFRWCRTYTDSALEATSVRTADQQPTGYAGHDVWFIRNKLRGRRSS